MIIPPKRVKELIESGSFDERWYRAAYPDVAASGLTPAEHYLWLGARLGRSPLAPDVRSARLRRRSGRPAQPAGPFQAGESSPDILFIDGTNGTSSTPYRVHHIAQGLGAQGWAARWVNGAELDRLQGLERAPAIAVFHRAPFWEPYIGLAERLRARGSIIVFDVDDLIFDEELMAHIDGFRHLPDADREGFIRAATAYREFILFADLCTAPTNFLVDRIAEFAKPAYRVRNAISRRNLEFFQAAGYRRPGRPSPFVIGYYSGTRTHQADFRPVAPALVEFMAEQKDVIFRLIGDFDLGEYPELAEFGRIRRRGDSPRVTKVGLMPHDAMLRDQLSCDLILAPLEVGNPFCEAKSELKYFEAALAGAPVIASPTRTFREASEDGKLARLATSSEEWLAAFRDLYADYRAALDVAGAASDQVRRRYSEEYAAEEAASAYISYASGTKP